jgi:alkanesulfonate monooxygenase SsuD/methylene tetrahydromethanopterin reductase-like flavin-dependent oxidoreductase (luciferase family)
MIQLALAALLPGVREHGGTIGSWGIDMAQDTEYGSQRPSCEYWLGVAEGLGVRAFIAERADLLKCAFRYMDDDESENEFVAKFRHRTGEIQSMYEQATNQAEQFRSQLEQSRYQQHRVAGALENQMYWQTRWFQPEGTRKGQDDESMKAAEPASA